MRIIVPNLHRRPDKKEAMIEHFEKYGHTDYSFKNAHDAEDYTNMACLLDAMDCSGWNFKHFDACLILGEKDKAKIPIRPMPHMAFRWTYLDILRDIAYDNKEAVILIDDMYLPYTRSDYEAQFQLLKDLGGYMLGLDPIEESDADSPQVGYDCPTEEAVFYTPKGAEEAIGLILSSPEMVIGDVYRYMYPTNRVFTTPKLMAVGIGNKSDWGSDIHETSESRFR